MKETHRWWGLKELTVSVGGLFWDCDRMVKHQSYVSITSEWPLLRLTARWRICRHVECSWIVTLAFGHIVSRFSFLEKVLQWQLQRWRRSCFVQK